MSSFQEWSDQLSKRAPILIPLNKIAVAKDNSYSKLYDLLMQGYDRVRWVNTEELQGSPCPLCKQIAEQVNHDGGIDLANFLGFRKNLKFVVNQETGEKQPDFDENGMQKFDLEPVVEIYKNAPLYNWSHVGCRCLLLVFNSNDTERNILVTRAG